MHAAGQDGMGSSSYIDSLVLRDADLNASGGFGGASDGTLEARAYYLQNWRADVVAMARTDGYLAEQIRYSAYGTPTSFQRGDIADDAGNALPSTGVNSGVNDGDYNLFFQEYIGAGAPADMADDTGGWLPSWGLNNGVNDGDYNFFFAVYWEDGVFGRGALSNLGNRHGYAGYEYDPILTGGYYHVRNRVYDSGNGRWTRRDPLGYVDGMGLYQYCQDRPEVLVDPFGLCGNTLDCTVMRCARYPDPALVRKCVIETLEMIGMSIQEILARLAAMGLSGLTTVGAATAAAPTIVKVAAVGIGLSIPEFIDQQLALRRVQELACRTLFIRAAAECGAVAPCMPGDSSSILQSKMDQILKCITAAVNYNAACKFYPGTIPSTAALTDEFNYCLYLDNQGSSYGHGTRRR